MLAKLAIIWMHGLGDRGSSWRSMQTDMAEVGVPIKWQVRQRGGGEVLSDSGQPVSCAPERRDKMTRKSAPDAQRCITVPGCAGGSCHV